MKPLSCYIVPKLCDLLFVGHVLTKSEQNSTTRGVAAVHFSSRRLKNFKKKHLFSWILPKLTVGQFWVWRTILDIETHQTHFSGVNVGIRWLVPFVRGVGFLHHISYNKKDTKLKFCVMNFWMPIITHAKSFQSNDVNVSFGAFWDPDLRAIRTESVWHTPEVNISCLLL